MMLVIMTQKTWTIILIDTRKSSIIGFVNFVGTHQITYKEYCNWHAT